MSRIMRLLHRITRACMRGREDPLRIPVFQRFLAVQLQLHELVHIASHEDVTVQQNHAIVLLYRERDELRPCLGESGVLRVLAGTGRRHVGDPLGWDAAGLEYFETLGGETGGVEGDEGVAGALGWCRGGIGVVERVVEG